MTDREEAHRLLDAAFDLLDHEAKANSAEARAAAQAAALTVLNAIFDQAGWRDFLQRRLVTFIVGKPEGSPSEAGELAKLVEQRRNFRRALTRLLYDLPLLPASLKTIWELVMAEEGREEEGREREGGGVFEPDPVAGVRSSPSTEILKIELVEKIGYTAGAAGLPETRRLTDDLLQRAHGAWRRYTLKRTGDAPDPVTSETIRIWCTRPGRLAEVFNAAYERGGRDKRANRIDRSKLLARVN